MRILKFFACFWLLFLLSCTTTSSSIKLIQERSRLDLKAVTFKTSPPELPTEKIIRGDLERFKSILNKRKPLSKEDWTLHDQLLDYYIQLKEGASAPNKVYIPAQSRWTTRFESYCLNSKKAVPEENERLLWKKAQSKIPYLKELLSLASKSKDISQEDIQTLIWNLHNKTVWEDYPLSLQKILLSVDPKVPKNCPLGFRKPSKMKF